MFALMCVHRRCLSTFCFDMSHICIQLCSCFWFYFAGSQSSVFTSVPALPVLEPVCLRALHDEHGKLDRNTETSEITDREKAESDSQRTGEEEGLEPAKKKLKEG